MVLGVHPADTSSSEQVLAVTCGNYAFLGITIGKSIIFVEEVAASHRRSNFGSAGSRF
jgi:hypothetical protein